jgi:hypothetical protein
MSSKFQLAVCELFHKTIHGFVYGESHPTMPYHYLINTTFTKTEFYDRYDMIEDYCTFLNDYYSSVVYQRLKNKERPFPIRNYLSIIHNEDRDYISPEIVEKHELSGKEYVCVLKTYWLKLIQRTWKKIYSKQQEVWNKRQRYSSILYREINGSWPPDCYYYPTLNGMLSYLSSG